MSELDFPLPDGVDEHSFADADSQAKALAEAVAECLKQAIEARGQALLLVSGGRSPVAFFELLSQAELSWCKVQIGLVDERWVPVDDPNSNQGLVERHLLKNNAQAAHFVGLYQSADTPDASAQLADEMLHGWPWPADVVVLGMGEDGHTASLFPDTPNLVQALQPTGQRACLATQAPSEPVDRLTLTLPRLISACHQFLQIQGETKRRMLVRASLGEILPIAHFLSAPLQVYWCP